MMTMKKLLATGVALATVLASLASPAFAAPPKHRAPVANDTMAPYGQSTYEQDSARHSGVVTQNGRIVGEDPDPNIRTQLLRDPDPSGF
jgi:hypothetical protein